jgi:hypothetical protein
MSADKSELGRTPGTSDTAREALSSSASTSTRAPSVGSSRLFDKMKGPLTFILSGFIWILFFVLVAIVSLAHCADPRA